MDFSNITNIEELLKAGGPVLIFLIFLSIVSLTIILERFFTLRKQIKMSRKLIAYAKYQLQAGQIDKIIEACGRDIAKNTPAGRLIKTLLTSNRQGANLKDYSDEVIDWEVTLLHKKLPVLATLGSTTPFIGLFGTVLGVMRAFADLAAMTAATAGPSVVAKGIAEALINTAAGLFVAVPAVIAYNYFTTQINFFERELENIASEITHAR
ncbi:Biopolymer transport protein [Elusimicrobium minutum Pei191]|uniref:Biopolymer transport protein n=1 Tax=Elusimicrobium minutum (strain Pei191) TaxID=445932 RepID=B2KBH8_ELUMP|nr:MotA/TolQ/ExbB proton channel family protein [Elusimicrobium minutum]ACC98000.1 Biopolymer transport protein [Elusimicrobium minutum Pei191]